jgi:crossover junction endodeoxyribonuclease RuvC
MIILGLDPGSQRTGYGVIRLLGRTVERVDHGVVAVSARLPLPERLRRIHAGVQEIMSRHAPNVVAIESIFHSENARSALVLGHVRGVILLVAAQANVEIREYSPATVKAQVCGNGRAEKSQVAFMVARHLSLSVGPPAGDAADALAVALCAAQHPQAEAAS